MDKIKALGTDIARAVRQYYGALLVALVATGAFIERAQSVSEPLLKLGFVGMLGISLLFALHFIQQRYRIRWPLPIAGFLVLAAYYMLLPDFDGSQFGPVTAIILGVSSICFHLLAATGPFLKRGDTDGFWSYNKSLFVNLVQTAVFTVVLWGGLALAVVAVENLFGLDVGSVFWERLAWTILILGSSLIYALFSKDGWGVLKQSAPYPPVLRFFVQYVLVPLLVIYLVILYSYGIKIVVAWDLPKGWVSYLVLAYSFLGILSLLLLHPLYDVTEKVWVRFFSRSFYLTLLPLLALLFVAIGVRVAAYGFTENRYYVLLLALWLLGMAVYQLLRRQNEIKVIPVSLLVVGVLSLLTPFGNVFSVSFNSQINRFHRLLAAEEALTSGKIDFNQPVKRSALNEIANVFQYLNTRNQHRIIRTKIPDDRMAKVDSLLTDKWGSESEFARLFVHVIEDDDGSKRLTFTRLTDGRLSYEQLYDVKEYDYIIPWVYIGAGHAKRQYTLGADSLRFEIGSEYPNDLSKRQLDSISNTISLYGPDGDTVFRHNFTAFVDSVYAQYAGQLFVTEAIEVNGLVTRFRLDTYEVELRFNELGFDRGESNPSAEVPLDSISVNKVTTILIKARRETLLP